MLIFGLLAVFLYRNIQPIQLKAQTKIKNKLERNVQANHGESLWWIFYSASFLFYVLFMVYIGSVKNKWKKLCSLNGHCWHTIHELCVLFVFFCWWLPLYWWSKKMVIPLVSSASGSFPVPWFLSLFYISMSLARNKSSAIDNDNSLFKISVKKFKPIEFTLAVFGISKSIIKTTTYLK